MSETAGDIPISLACWDYDRTQALLDGAVTVPGVKLDIHVAPPAELFPVAVQEAKYDVTELSVSSYMMQTAAGTSAYTAIPVFVSRAFRHGSIFVNADAGIEEPEDLEGKVLGVPEYQMTAALWVRGILADEYGINPARITWLTGAQDAGVRKERQPLDLPPDIDVQPIEDGETLDGLLRDGDLDAMIAPSPPKSFLAGEPHIRRLFPDVRVAERAYYEATGFFPIMHLIAVRKTLAEQHPWLCERLYEAFAEARERTIARMGEVYMASANRSSLPWFGSDVEEVGELMGANFWAYGLEANRAELEAMCRYSHAQHLSSRLLGVEELFHASFTEDSADRGSELNALPEGAAPE